MTQDLIGLSAVTVGLLGMLALTVGGDCVSYWGRSGGSCICDSRVSRDTARMTQQSNSTGASREKGDSAAERVVIPRRGRLLPIDLPTVRLIVLPTAYVIQLVVM
jgi:hypothetical protein